MENSQLLTTLGFSGKSKPTKSIDFLNGSRELLKITYEQLLICSYVHMFIHSYEQLFMYSYDISGIFFHGNFSQFSAIAPTKNF